MKKKDRVRKKRARLIASNVVKTLQRKKNGRWAVVIAPQNALAVYADSRYIGSKDKLIYDFIMENGFCRVEYEGSESDIYGGIRVEAENSTDGMSGRKYLVAAFLGAFMESDPYRIGVSDEQAETSLDKVEHGRYKRVCAKARVNPLYGLPLKVMKTLGKASGLSDDEVVRGIADLLDDRILVKTLLGSFWLIESLRANIRDAGVPLSKIIVRSSR